MTYNPPFIAEVYEESKWPSRYAAIRARRERAEVLDHAGWEVTFADERNLRGEKSYYLFAVPNRIGTKPVTPTNIKQRYLETASLSEPKPSPLLDAAKRILRLHDNPQDLGSEVYNDAAEQLRRAINNL